MAEILASRTEHERAAILAELSDREIAGLEWDWRFWGRPAQIAPGGEWLTWMALAGRGWGKTETGAQWIRERVRDGARSIALIAETQKDLEEVMVPRILSVHPEAERPTARYKPVRIIWPNGAMALGYNGTEPDQLRGPEFDTAWVDELAKYRYARDLWDMLQFTMRKPNPRVFISTTPRPIPVIKEIIAARTTVISRGSTNENKANLPPEFLKAVTERYEGTRLGRQELGAEILDDVPGALWTREMLDKSRVKGKWDADIGRVVRADGSVIEMARIVIGVDPSGSSGDEEKADDIGIVACGKGMDGKGYVLGDWTLNGSPAQWGKRSVDAYKFFRGDRIVAEKNFGGDMVNFVIRTADQNVPVTMVNASRGKIVRAEPIAALYEQGRVSHVGAFPEMEDQACQMTADGYVGDGSPDRVDAKVWALTELMLGDGYDLGAAL